MLTITIQGDELWDDEAEVFSYTDSIVLEFEHSLVSLSKWEAKYHKLFLTPDAKTNEEMAGYLEAMLQTPNVSPETLNLLNEEHMQEIDEYINNPMTGTTISNMPTNGKNAEKISSELIYFWMSQYKIDKDCETWHLNRLFTLIKVHYAKTQKEKKVPRQQRVQTMAEQNAARKAKLGTTG